MKKSIQFLLLGLLAFASSSVYAALKINHWQTTSGSEVYFVENHDLPIIDIAVNFPAGSARDSKEKSGIASVTRYMMTLGADGMGEEEITNKFADIGAILGGDLDTDRAALKLRSLTSEQGKALETFSKILHKPDFPQTVLDREKTRIVAGLKEAETQPESIASKAFMKALYGAHPYGLDGSGEVDTIQAIKREDLLAFYQTYYTAKSATIALIGDMTEAQARQIADTLSTQLPQTPAVGKLPEVAFPTTPNVQNINHPATQAHILLGYPGIKRGDADYWSLYVGNYILGGGGFVARLTEEVREKRGLVYSVYSYFMPMSELGPFQIGLQTEKSQANDAMKVVNETVAKYIAGGPTDKELKAAKANIIGGFPMRIDSNGKILDYLSVIGFYKLPLTFLDDYNTHIAAVTTKQIKEAFKRRVKPENFVSVIVGAQ
ncbi:MAG: M16 family metallopeptidase [Methylophilaceae bacterium]